MADPYQHYYGHQGEEYLEQDEYYDEEQYPCDPSQDRPSFTTYWKKSKEHQSSSSRGHKNIRFVQTTVAGPGGSSYAAAGDYGSGTDTDAGMGSDMGSAYMSGADCKCSSFYNLESPPPLLSPTQKDGPLLHTHCHGLKFVPKPSRNICHVTPRFPSGAHVPRNSIMVTGAIPCTFWFNVKLYSQLAA